MHSLDLPVESAESFREEFFSGDRLDYELIDYIRALRPQYRTALLSNAFSDLRALVTDYWHFADAFDALVVSAEEGLMKPDVRLYQIAVERLGVAPQEAVFIDDFERNIVGARQAGLHAIHFKDPQEARRQLAQLLQENGA
jgi:putative hydrolase of the HAD superfamily